MGVAYLTLIERKILRYVQVRKGPNKVGIIGIFQPLRDGIKLIFKEFFFIYKSNYLVFYICPLMSLWCILVIWTIIPWVTNLYFINYSILIIFVFMSLRGFILIIIGWSSNSSYSLLGSIRFVAQSVSYEIRFILIVYALMLLRERYSLKSIIFWQLYIWNIIRVFPVFLSFFISAMAELNRRPIDLIEGESELVSGFNIEYFRGAFVLIFLGEYGMILFQSYVIMLLFTNLFLLFYFIIFGLCITIVLIIYIRGLLPRMRYDELIYMCWKIILPLTLNYLLIIFRIKFLILTFL